MMRTTFFLVTLVWFYASQAGALHCDEVLNSCQEKKDDWTRCFTDSIASCTPRKTRFHSVPFVHDRVNISHEAKKDITSQHYIHIPSSALQMSRGNVGKEEEVLLVSTVINSSYFKTTPTPAGRRLIKPPVRRPTGIVLGGLVLVVKVGTHPVRNLSQPIELFFKSSQQVENASCVFWDDEHGRGYWSTEGCNITDHGSEFICSCDHLSFFAVLVNPVLKVDKNNALNLSYITYTGSALSVVFTFISLIIYICLRRRRPDSAIGLHMQLTGALLCLHLSFLLSSFLVRLQYEKEDGWLCKVLGFFLHWSLLATFTWSALEGFHLYLLLVRVFNIYVRRYLLKLSLFGWGLPTLVAVVCAISGVYGTSSLKDGSSQTSVAHICWMRSQFPHMLLVSYITTVAFPCLVILYNFCILGVVVFKLCGLRRGSRGFERGSSWKNMNRGKWTRLWKDCATVVGLSCVLGLPWSLASTTYISLPGIYVFTIFNSLQGVFVFLWSVALICKPGSEDNSSVRDQSSQKMMTTSFDN